MDVLEFITVTLYGNIIMLLFTKEKKSIRQIIGLAAVYVTCGLTNLFLNSIVNKDVIYMLYPLTVHLPLLLYFVFAVRTPVSQAVFALTAAYILTTPRKWICELIYFIFNNGIIAYTITQIVVTATLLLLITRFVSPVVIRIFNSSQKETGWLCLFPATVYAITYATTVYSNFLFQYPMITIPVLTTVLSTLFIGFEIYFFDYASEKASTRHNKELLELQLRSVERLAQHMDSVENYFCENKTLNAFLSMYASAAKTKDIFFTCNCNLTQGINIDDSLVSLTSMLDDAMNKSKKYIKVEALQKKSQICIMTETDGEGEYDPIMLATLNSVVRKNKGIIYFDKKSYKIQISIKKGEM